MNIHHSDRDPSRRTHCPPNQPFEAERKLLKIVAQPTKLYKLSMGC